MSRYRRLLDDMHPKVDSLLLEERQFRLVQMISIELIILSVALFFFFFYWRLYEISILSFLSSGLYLLNLFELYIGKRTRFSAHGITFLSFLALCLGNYWLGGYVSPLNSWFNIIPLIATVTLGFSGLAIYAVLTFVVFGIFIFMNCIPIYTLSTSMYLFLTFFGHVVFFVIMVTVLFILLNENRRFESSLGEKNLILQSDKEKFHYLSHYDVLTELPNRNFFHSQIQHYIDEAVKSSKSVTVYFMDLNEFKSVNDLYGHDAGDLLLTKAAQRLNRCFRQDDMVARLGGDEFTAVVMHYKNDKIPFSLAKRILDEFNEPFDLGGDWVSCHISIGMASYPKDGNTVYDLISKADKAMYKAKKTGASAYHMIDDIIYVAKKKSE